MISLTRMIGIKRYYTKLYNFIIFAVIFTIVGVVAIVIKPTQYAILATILALVVLVVVYLRPAINDIKKSKRVLSKLDESKYHEGVIDGYGYYSKSRGAYLKLTHKSKVYTTPPYFTSTIGAKLKGKKVVYQIIEEEVIIITVLN